MSLNPFDHSRYEIRKQMLKLFGGAFRIYDPTGTLAIYAQMKAFKLKEELTLYTDESMTNPVLGIKARSVLDVSATYDITDLTTHEKVGALKRKGLKSLFKDEWIIMDSLDQEIGFIKEDSALMAFLRRLMGELAVNLIPQRLHGDVKGFPVFHFRQNSNPFTLRIDLDFSEDVNNLLDRRLGLAAAVMLCAIEGRQQ